MSKIESTTSDPIVGKAIYLLILVVIVQTIYPITINENPLPLILYQVLYASMMVTGIFLARDHKRFMWTLILMAVIWLVTGTYYALNPQAFEVNILTYIVLGIFIGMIISVLLRFIFRAEKISIDTIYAACAVYLLLGAVFVPVYGIIETLTWFPDLQAHAFTDGIYAYEGMLFPWQTIIYYSYATLTTLGYGDVLPVTFWARAVSSMEAIIGVLYITIIMARLVGLYASAEVDKEFESHEQYFEQN